MVRRFLVVARPRSRTSWLTTFLNAGGVVCQHDIIDICPGPAAYREAMNIAGISGAVDTGAVLVLPEILKEIPDLIVAIIDRPRSACEESMFQLGVNMDMDCYDVPMQLTKNLPNTLTLDHWELDDEAAVRGLWAFLTGLPFPKRWYEHCKHMHIELSKRFFDDFVARSQDPSLLRGWSIEPLLINRRFGT